MPTRSTTRQALAALVLLFFTLNYVAPIDPVLAARQETSAGQGRAQKPVEPISRLVLGPIAIESFANVSRHQDKLRLSKAYYKFVTRKLTPNSDPIATHKISTLIELVRCDNLNQLLRPEVVALVECLPLESYVTQTPKESASSSGTGSKSNVLYALRYTIKLKDRYLWSESGSGAGTRTLTAYALRDEVTQSEIETTLAGHGIDSAPFQKPHTSSGGFYTEVSFALVQQPSVCSGNVFLALNTSLLATLDKSPMFEFGQLGSVLRAGRQGFVVSASHSCSLANLDALKLENKFSAVYQRQFPYWSLRHSAQTEPLRQIFEYLGEVHQSRDEAQPAAYNTTIRMQSHSSVYPNAKWNLEQDFVNQAQGQEGWEQMTLVHPALAALVHGNWSADSLVKTLELFRVEPEPGGFGSFGANSEPAFQVSYANKPEEEFVTLNLKLDRGLFASLMAADGARPTGGVPADANLARNEL